MAFFGLFGPPNVEKLAANRNVSGLIKALSYEADPRIRLQAAKALGMVGDRRAVEPLIAALTDRGFNLIQGEHDLLLRGDDYIKRKDRYNVVCWTAAESLDQLDFQWPKSPAAQAAVPQLMAVLRDQQLISTKDRDYGVRRLAVETLGKIGDRRALPALVAMLSDQESDLRYCAVDSLGLLGDPAAVPSLLQVLFSGDFICCKASFRVLTQLDPSWPSSPSAQSLIPRFTSSLTSHDDCIRWASSEALLKMGVSPPGETGSDS